MAIKKNWRSKGTGLTMAKDCPDFTAENETEIGILIDIGSSKSQDKSFEFPSTEKFNSTLSRARSWASFLLIM